MAELITGLTAELVRANLAKVRERIAGAAARAGRDAADVEIVAAGTLEDLGVLVEVNVAGEPGKSGVAPADLAAFLGRAPIPVAGLMTMAPRADDPQDSRRWFQALRELAERHDLRALSMG